MVNLLKIVFPGLTLSTSVKLDHVSWNFSTNFAHFSVFLSYYGKNVNHNIIFGILNIFMKQVKVDNYK